MIPLFALTKIQLEHWFKFRLTNYQWQTLLTFFFILFNFLLSVIYPYDELLCFSFLRYPTQWWQFKRGQCKLRKWGSNHKWNSWPSFNTKQEKKYLEEGEIDSRSSNNQVHRVHWTTTKYFGAVDTLTVFHLTLPEVPCFTCCKWEQFLFCTESGDSAPVHPAEEIEVFLGTCMWMSVVLLKNTRWYWSEATSIADSLTLDYFEQLKYNLHFVDNHSLSKRWSCKRSTRQDSTAYWCSEWSLVTDPTGRTHVYWQTDYTLQECKRTWTALSSERSLRNGGTKGLYSQVQVDSHTTWRCIQAKRMQHQDFWENLTVGQVVISLLDCARWSHEESTT